MKKPMILIPCLVLFSLAIGSTESDHLNKSVSPLKTEHPPKIDGRLDEEIWQQAPAASGFRQYEPDRGKPANFVTTVRILYDRQAIYFGVNCADPEPDRIVARVTKREGDLEADDALAVALDTFNDDQSAYIFFTNLLGTQRDGRLSDNGRTFDDTWDAEWRSAGLKTQTGWTAEIAIPLTSLKFRPGKNRTWGLGISRFIPRNLEVDTWTGPMEFYQRVSQFGTIEGLALPVSGKRLQVIPHVVTKIQKERKTDVNIGLDARYAFSPSVSANLTVNPDFATVEADQEQINLTRFELQLQEKRNFFLEGSEIYSQRIRLFYSRRIADIHGGLKIYGKSRQYDFSILSAQSKGDDERGEESANFTVLRLRKNIFRTSNIGFLLANKMVDGRYTGSAGLDLVHFFSPKVNLTGQLAVSYGEKNRQNVAFFVRPSYDSSTFHFHVRYTQLGKHFGDNANAVGFIRDDDRHELDSALEKTWWINKHGLDRIEYGSNYNIYWSIDGWLRSWQIDQELEIDLTNKLSFEIDYTREFKRYEKDFYNRQLGFEIGYNTREWQSARLKYESGKNFDSDYVLYGGEVNFKFSERTSIEYELDRLQLDPDPEQESTWLHVLRLNHYFTRDLFIKLFFQTHSAIARQNIQAVFVYRFQPPFGTIQLAYQKGTGRFGEKGHQPDTLFLKLSYVF
jgi:hypothetical protein